MQEPFRAMGGNYRLRRDTTARFTKQHDVIRVTTKLFNIALYPAQHLDLVENA